MAGEDAASFAKVLIALKPYLGDLVVVGGWAHRLYQFHERGRSPGFAPLVTDDADIAATRARIPRQTKSMADLLARDGFKQEFLGDEQRPVTHYYLGDEDGAFYVEFIVPLLGSEYRRDGTRDATANVAGVIAQKLRYVDILVMAPWTVHLSEHGGFPVGAAGIDVQIPNPVSYLVQKMLILPSRPRDKQAKDVLYIHDTLLILGESLDDLRPVWRDLSVSEKVRKTVVGERAKLFSDVTDLARSAARIAAATNRPDPPSAEQLVATCRMGLARVFDERTK